MTQLPYLPSHLPSLLWVCLVGCGGGGTDTNVTSDSSDPGPTETADYERSMAYLAAGRVCMGETAGGGGWEPWESADATNPPWDLYEPCAFDIDCQDASYSSCRHLADAADPPDLSPFAVPLEHPSPPSGGTSGYFQRFVPLCTDGSGDHEYSVMGEGEAPTCAPEEWVRCADGTRPYYFLKAGSGASLTNEWLIWAGAGGHELLNGRAWLSYHGLPSSYGLGTSADNERGGLAGIFSDTAGGDQFTDWNRLFVEKCTPDRFLGRATAQFTIDAVDCSEFMEEGCEGILEPPRNDPDFVYDVYLHGALIVEAVLSDLADGVSTYSDYTVGAPVVAEDFAPLSEAERVLLTCHSNGCNGLKMSLDQRTELIEDLAPQADVRAVFNNFFPASIVGEWAVDETSENGEILSGRSSYDQVVTGLSIANDVDGGLAEISLTTWQPGGSHQAGLALYGADLDASCAAYHSDDQTLCRDSMHVLFNHLGTPFFYNLAQADTVLTGGNMTVSAHCETTPGEAEPCTFVGVERSWQQMIRKQVADLVLLGETERCEADAEGPAPYDRIAVWAPASRDHEGWHQDSVVSYQLSLSGGTPMTLRDAVRRWVDTDDVKGVVMEVDSGVDPSASNVALGLPEATSGP